MSGYRGHCWMGALFFVGLAAGVTLAATVVTVPHLTDMFRSWWMTLALLGTVLLAALWPDVDTNSKGRYLFYRAFLAAALALILLGRLMEAAVLGLLAMLPNVGKHHGWTHTLRAAVGLSSMCPWLPMYVARAPTLAGLPFAIASLVGYLSHLLLDRKRP